MEVGGVRQSITRLKIAVHYDEGCCLALQPLPWPLTLVNRRKQILLLAMM